MNIQEQLRELWTSVGGDEDAFARLALPPGPDVLPSSFKLDDVAQGLIGLSTLAASECLRVRGGPAAKATVSRLHAAAEFRSDRYIRMNGQAVADVWDPLAGLYECADGWVRIHTNFPHHRQGILDLLQCAPTRQAVAAELKSRKAQDFEDEVVRRGLVAKAVRSYDAWQVHPQAQALEQAQLVDIQHTPSTDAVRQMPAWTDTCCRPLSGVKVLDLTRIIAGPVAGRTLAAHGAQVLHISASHLPSIDELLIDTGRGKHTAALDLRQPADAQRLRELIAEADVFLQGYRPGGLDSLGFDHDTLHKLNPGLVIADLCAFGFAGPWAKERGFDSLTQAATGFNLDEMAAFGDSKPRALPTQALDHGAGYLLALGIMSALAGRQLVGGGWRVRVSLAGTGRWVRSLGRQEVQGRAFMDPGFDEVAAAGCLGEWDCFQGTMTGVRHSGIIEGCAPPAWAHGAYQLGHHEASWW